MHDYLPFQRASIFFQRSIPSGISLTNKHLPILDGHGSHVTLETIEQAKEFRLYMINLLSHTSHAFQPLDVVCFKPFKNDFEKERDATMVKRNYKKLDTIILARWANKALDLIFTKKNIMSKFKNTRIWPLNPRSMDSKIDLSILYTLQAMEEEESK
jgi:hypothetical protein